MLPDLPPSIVGALADTPLALVLMWMVVQLRRDLAARAEPPPPAPGASARELAVAAEAARAELAAFKLEVARTYVPLSLIRDLDARLTRQLSRFEEKLDEVSRAATAAAAVSAQSLPGRGIGFATRAAGPEAQP